MVATAWTGGVIPPGVCFAYGVGGVTCAEGARWATIRDVPRTSSSLADSGEAFAGALLLATPLIEEPTFRRTVVLMLEHDDGGSLGVILNDLSAVPAADVLPAWGGVLHPQVALGGPVQADAGVAVAQLHADAMAAPPAGLRLLAGPWAVIDLDQDPDQVTAALADAQLFVGYAGWSVGQLDAELAQGSWWVVESRPGDLELARRTPRDYCWSKVLRRQPNDLRFASTFPPDPALN
ncbi:MAG: putative transcriptional regulator [Actinomycetota bacterium]|nr:putative transcriptional regulator [Actinomycetota bacterium]